MLLTTGVLTSPPPASPPPTAQLCQSSGAKHLSPPLAETEACARFLTGIAGVPEVTGVELKILPQGVLNAVVTRSGMRGSPRDYTLAVSDRAMTPEDLNLDLGPLGKLM